jgi:acyl-CoA dehydrogenase
MAIGIETSRLAVQRAGRDMRRNSTYWASIAKCLAADVANNWATNAIQIFGGAGFSCEYPVKKLLRDAKLFQIIEVTAQSKDLSLPENYWLKQNFLHKYVIFLL